MRYAIRTSEFHRATTNAWKSSSSPVTGGNPAWVHDHSRCVQNGKGCPGHDEGPSTHELEGPRQPATSTTDRSAAAAAGNASVASPPIARPVRCVAPAMRSLAVGLLRRCAAHRCAAYAHSPIARRVRFAAPAPSAPRPIARTARFVALCPARFLMIARQVASRHGPCHGRPIARSSTSEPPHRLPRTRWQLQFPAAPCVPGFPPGRSPSPVTRRISSPGTVCPARGSPDVIRRVSRSTGHSTARCHLSPGNGQLSTDSSTDLSTVPAGAVHLCPPSGRPSGQSASGPAGCPNASSRTGPLLQGARAGQMA